MSIWVSSSRKYSRNRDVKVGSLKGQKSTNDLFRQQNADGQAEASAKGEAYHYIYALSSTASQSCRLLPSRLSRKRIRTILQGMIAMGSRPLPAHFVLPDQLI